MTITRRPVASTNFREGRRGWDVDAIVIHVTEGSRSSVRNWFDNPVAEVSAHYMVCTDGSVDQFVEEYDTAYHAGRVLNPTADLVREQHSVNPNLYTIGIEHEGSGRSDLTEKQRTASVELIRSIQSRHPHVLSDRRHIFGHREVYAAKPCPGKISVEALLAELVGETKRPVVVWSDASRDWLVVTRVVNDAEWYFVPLAACRRGTMYRASTPLSQMPLVKP